MNFRIKLFVVTFFATLAFILFTVILPAWLQQGGQ